MNKVLGVYGAGGCGRGIMPLLRQQAGTLPRGQLYFIDDHCGVAELNGQPVASWAQFVALECREKALCIAIANSVVREKLALACAAAGVGFVSVTAANVVIMDDVTIGEGAILSPFVTITSNVRIGRHFHANLYSYIEHDCIVGDFVTLAPGAHVNGNIVLEDHAYVGSGAVIKHGLPGKPIVIGRGAVVGAGAVVTKSVPPGVTVVGNPARPLVKPGQGRA